MTTDNREAPSVNEFIEWLDDYRASEIGPMFHEIVARYRAALSTHKEAGEPVAWKHWCETCEGLGWFDERLGGYHFSNPKAPCPDCDGNGYWTRRQPQESVLSSPAASVGSASEEELAEASANDAVNILMKQAERKSLSPEAWVKLLEIMQNSPARVEARRENHRQRGEAAARMMNIPLGASQPSAPCTALASAGQDEKSPVSQVPPTERTPEDYAIEHAEYMAQTAEGLLQANIDLYIAERRLDDFYGDEEPPIREAAKAAIEEAKEAVNEYCFTLRNNIYEFRKRRDRALLATTKGE